VLAQLITPKTKVKAPVSAYAMEGPSLLLIELSGATSANEAIFAHLASKRNKKKKSPVITGLTILGGPHKIKVFVNPQNKLMRVQAKDTLIVLEEGMTKFRRRFLLDGDESNASPWFLATLANTIDVPLLPEWENPLWAEGIRIKLLERAPSHNCGVWRIKEKAYTNDEKYRGKYRYGTYVSWTKMIQTLIQEGELNHG